MKCIPVHEAIGHILYHDITEIVPGKCKGPSFRRGHVVVEADIPHLLRLGKENVYVADSSDCLDTACQETIGTGGAGGKRQVHEDEAAQRIATAIAGNGVVFGDPREGRINLSAAHPGLLQINVPLLDRLNSIPDVTIATIHSNQGVVKGRTLAGTRVIPLSVPEGTVSAVEECCRGEQVLSVLPYKSFQVGIVTTGSEVYSGRIQDGFGPVLRQKFADVSIPVLGQTIVPDTTEVTVAAITEMIESGASFVVVSGGMSVDPDDKTPAAIREVADQVICYGAPIFPGAMFMLAYKGMVPILGLPGCVMYHRASIFDILLPRLLAGVHITRHDVIKLAHGGLCEGCATCHYPACGFGKG